MIIAWTPNSSNLEHQMLQKDAIFSLENGKKILPLLIQIQVARSYLLPKIVWQMAD